MRLAQCKNIFRIELSTYTHLTIFLSGYLNSNDIRMFVQNPHLHSYYNDDDAISNLSMLERERGATT